MVGPLHQIVGPLFKIVGPLCKIVGPLQEKVGCLHKIVGALFDGPAPPKDSWAPQKESRARPYNDIKFFGVFKIISIAIMRFFASNESFLEGLSIHCMQLRCEKLNRGHKKQYKPCSEALDK